MKLTKLLLPLAVMATLACEPTGGNIISGASPSDGPKPDILTVSLGGPRVVSTDGGIFVIESYGVPYDGGIKQPDSGAANPPTTSCTPGSVYLCEPLCANGKHSQTQCNTTGDGFVQKPDAIAFGICYCGEDPWVFPPDAATIPPPAIPDASIPDTIVVKTDVPRPDLAPDVTTKTDVYVAGDVYMPDVYVPPVTLPPPSPDASPMPDLRTPDVYVPDTYIAPDLFHAPDVFVPDVYVPDVFVPTDIFVAPDTTPDTRPDILPDTLPPPECTTESPTNVSGITLSQSGQCQFTVVWTVDGCSSMGYKVIWSKNPGPTFPTRSGDRYAYLPDPSEKSLEINTDGPGTYYVRVCQYLGGKCGLYSNELVITLN